MTNPGRLVDEATQRLDDWSERLANAIGRTLSDAKSRLVNAGVLLESCSYERVLERGFVLVRDIAARPLRTIAALSPGQDIGLQFHDGAATARVSGIPANKNKKSAKNKPAKKADDRQGELL